MTNTSATTEATTTLTRTPVEQPATLSDVALVSVPEGNEVPAAVLLLSHTTAIVILSIVWGGAILGVGMKLITPNAPRWLSAPVYVALGWVAIVVLPEIARGGGMAALVLLLIGGMLYTVGAAFYALRRPNPWPKTFGHHEFFHACSLLAALCHQVALYFALFR